MADKTKINKISDESVLKNSKKSDTFNYKNDIKNTLKDTPENPMQEFRISRMMEHKKSLLRKDPDAIKKIRSLLKNIKIEKDSEKRVITLNLKNKYTIVEPNLDKISDDVYKREIDTYKIEPSFTHYVKTRWNRWGISRRLNKSLQEYTKDMKKNWFNIPTKDETNNILKEIWEISGLDNDILMDVFTYLTGLRGNLLLKSSEKNNLWEKTIHLWRINWYESVDWDYPIKLFFLKKW